MSSNDEWPADLAAGILALPQLERALRVMVDRLIHTGSNPEKARQVIISAAPDGYRDVWAALLKRPRGRTKGDDGGKKAMREVQIKSLYRMKLMQDPNTGPKQFAKWLYEDLRFGSSIEANYKKVIELQKSNRLI
jgi:hypothetical protein